MYKLSFLIAAFFVLGLHSFAQKSTVHGPNFKTDCKTCHNSKGWKIDMENLHFNHDSTGFPLDGQHKNTDCKQCHKALNFTEAKTNCNQCHTDMHQSTVGNDCVRCHNTRNWLVTNIKEMHDQSGFPIAGAHAVLNCIDCHKSETNQKWDRIGSECIDCHKTNFDASTRPNHLAANFSKNCTECHDPLSNDWGGRDFHTQFPLTNGHAIQDCNQCHANNDFKSASSDCVSCHKDTYDATTNPNHSLSGITTNCIECHNVTAINWGVSANFHNSFPLTLGHALNNCAQCHKAGTIYKSTSTDCASCHLTDYTNTANPIHTSLGFTSKCIDCHTTTPNWKPAKMENHDQLFPIYSGKHKGKWANCIDCHLNTNNYSQFSCTSCHEHNNQTEMAKEHNGVSGYVFDSNACLQCHPKGDS